MKTLKATFRIVTPMFISGADQNKAELRAPSIKGALRFWYRAIDPCYRDHETKIFGGAGNKDGQAMFLLRVVHDLKSEIWQRNVQCFDQSNPCYPNRPKHASANPKTWTLNGIRYLGYPFFFHENISREAIFPGGTFKLEFIFKNLPSEKNKKRILAALWLFGHLGSLGTRARRGFGTVQLDSLTTQDENQWIELKSLPIAGRFGSIEEWQDVYQQAFQTLREWFPENRVVDHTVFSSNSGICLVHTDANDCSNRAPWEYAMDRAGKIMQKFRQRWNLNNKNSDYYRVKQHLCKKDPNAAAQQPTISPRYLSDAPKRAAFGLPLTFRYSSLTFQYQNRSGKTRSKTPNISFEGNGNNRGRSASRIWIRVVLINDRAYPVFIRLDGPLLKDGDKIKLDKSGRHTLSPPDDALLDTFWNSLPESCKVRWSQP